MTEAGTFSRYWYIRSVADADGYDGLLFVDDGNLSAPVRRYGQVSGAIVDEIAVDSSRQTCREATRLTVQR